ncbi:hypothetical protein VTK73DRAFT_2543 [Phialemonium thermophilum]|uniref:HTH psq-type domain-containing protein n=1 Tax=Phialemonium thermophilum TaxID=223376 RepID=A0ABR3VS12_9PEZI
MVSTSLPSRCFGCPMSAAMAAVQGGSTVRTASRAFGIPRTTLSQLARESQSRRIAHAPRTPRMRLSEKDEARLTPMGAS